MVLCGTGRSNPPAPAKTQANPARGHAEFGRSSRVWLCCLHRTIRAPADGTRRSRNSRSSTVAWAPARFRAFPDDTGIALNGGKPVARVGPILKLLDGHMIAGLAAGTAGEECPRDIDHVRRALALVEQRSTAPRAEASSRLCSRVLEASNAPSALRLARGSDQGRGMPCCGPVGAGHRHY